ncbi:MAG TPA: redoxin domain-containing protein [Terriglobia bacterium]|jgi:peroxiredoxin Q/BCP
MKTKLFIGIAVLAAALSVPAFGQLTTGGVDNSPKVGDAAPEFAIPAAQRGAPPSNLKDFQGKKKVLVMFFPGAFTPGCTTEFTEAGKYQDQMNAMNIEMIGISADLPGAQNKFKETVGAKNTFVSDRSLAIAQKYDAVAANGNSAKRYYFLVDESGKVIWKSTNNSLITTDKLLGDLGQIAKK